MDTRILVATDGSAEASGAIRIALELAERDHRPLEVVSAVEPIVFDRLVLYEVNGQTMNATEHALVLRREQVRRQIQELGGEGRSLAPEIRVGSAAPTIVRFADQIGAGMIVMGLGKHDPVDRWLRGETALKTLHLARVPVLAAPAGATALPRRAVIAVDFSGYSENAVKAAMGILGDGAEVQLVHAVWSADGQALPGGDDWFRTYRAGARVRLEELAAEIEDEHDVRVTTALVGRHPAPEVLDIATRTRADIIAAGSHGYGFLSRMVMGSVSTALLRGAGCSVLIAPPQSDDAQRHSTLGGATDAAGNANRDEQRWSTARLSTADEAVR